MGILSNFIAGAASAGGEILQRERESGVRVKESQDIARFNDDLATKREQALMALRNEYQVSAEGRAEERTVAGEKRGLTNRATERQNIVDETVTNAPKLREVKVEDAKAVKKAEYGPEIQALMRKAETERLTAGEQAKLDFYNKNRKAILGQTRDEAQARHIESAGSLAQAALAKVQLENAQTASTLRTQLAEARASGNDDAVQAIQQQITDLAFTGKDTAKAYATYSTAQQKLFDLEAKLADESKMLSPGQVASIKSEIEEAKAVQRQAAKDLGVSIKDKGAADKTMPKPPPGALDEVAKNPKLREAFIAKYGADALPAPKVEVKGDGEKSTASKAPITPLFTRGPASPNYPGGEIIYTGPTLPTATGGGIIDPKRNWPGR